MKWILPNMLKQKLDVNSTHTHRAENPPQSRQIENTAFAWLCLNLLATWSFRKTEGIQKDQRLQHQPSVTQRNRVTVFTPTSRAVTRYFAQEEKQTIIDSSKIILKRTDVIWNRIWRNWAWRPLLQTIKTWITSN